MTIKPELGRYPWTPVEGVNREDIHLWAKYDVPLCGYFEHDEDIVVFRQMQRFGADSQYGVSVLTTLDDGDLADLEELLVAGRSLDSRVEFYNELDDLAETRPAVYVATTDDKIIAIY